MCENISRAQDMATDNASIGFKFYTTNSSIPAQRILKEEITKIKLLKSADTKLIHFLALIEVFGSDLFWIMDTEDSGEHFLKLLKPLLSLGNSLLKMSNKKLAIDKHGRKYVDKESSSLSY